MIVSPLSGKTSVRYCHKIEQKLGRYKAYAKSISNGQIVKQQTGDELCLLKDETARSVIDPDDADVIVTKKRQW